ncbi:MAG: NUDIX domain-containing protein [Candidatus Scalindua sp. AMX11]|nr:MAG: NUDIX domain-containing protein [Candidatus Scalindua sp.]NOG83135.1 NUDIX domain-containing protein [Planctomycetota bacterium]RZV75850.1 MAG: NUDIX domain-containing protein [Candidatus Scalindua sp. SCAELEC01]TDE64908.1 MAG: NUDIX domain-containing protein [Candidatus Scalindua sp. AMX11]GJQ60377.1 MAG: DNA mismatch repair protein MutT [Candidatus Scalindua sp.]
MTEENAIYYCLQCGTNKFKSVRANQFFCESCGFTYFQNIASSVAAIIECRNQILTCVREYDPCKGMMGLPGGFVDREESAELALKREIFEEVRIAVSEMHYVGSFPNVYQYKGVEYHTLDLFFSLRLKEKPQITIGDEIAAIEWIPREEITYEQFAFESMKKGLRRYLNGRSKA